jgi:hypothetical protein
LVADEGKLGTRTRGNGLYVFFDSQVEAEATERRHDIAVQQSF